MITAKDLHDVLAVLKRISYADMSQMKNPEFVGQLQAEAIKAGIALEVELAQHEVEIPA